MKKLDHSLSANELPLIVCILDFKNIVVDRALLDGISEVISSLLAEKRADATFRQVPKYKGGFLTYVLADESLDELKAKVDIEDGNLHYEFFLQIFNLLKTLKVGGGFAKELEKGSDSVFEQLSKHPLYQMKKEIINKGLIKKKTKKYINTI